MSKAKTKTYLFHEISSYLPLLEGEEFDALVEDIKEFGQIELAVLFEGKIIDGRNRYRACKQLGIELKVREWNPSEFTGMTPLQFVISENIMRRHLNTAQKSEVGLLLLEEEEKLAKEKMSELAKTRPRDERGKLLETQNVGELVDTKKYGEKGESAEKVGKKVKVSRDTIRQAKAIKKIAEKEPLIAEEWEKAKKGEQGVSAVYEKAKIIENIETLPKKHQEEIKKKISTEPVSKVIEVVRERKDEQKRLQDAKKYREMQKEKQEMEKLRLQIRSFEIKIEELENAIKSQEANLEVIIKEISEKYPKFASDDTDYVLTNLGVYYDGLKLDVYDQQIGKLKKEYDQKMEPLRKELERLESEFQEKKNKIDEEKAKISAEAIWVEKHQDSILAELDKIGIYKRKIADNKEELTKLQEKFDNEYKDTR